MTDSADARDAQDITVEYSALGDLRQLRGKTGAGSRPLYLPIPGFDDKLIVEYHWTDPDRLSRTGEQLSKMENANEQITSASADALVATCTEIHVRVPKVVDGEEKLVRKPLSTDGHPVTFSDPRLAYALGIDDPGNARDLTRATFNNDYALRGQAQVVCTWLEDTTKKVDGEYLGE